MCLPSTLGDYLLHIFYNSNSLGKKSVYQPLVPVSNVIKLLENEPLLTHFILNSLYTSLVCLSCVSVHLILVWRKQ